MSDRSDRSDSIYLHIPFCEVKCGYCDFYSVPRGWEEFDLQEQYVTQLCREIQLRCRGDRPVARPLQSIFFGGGTPSLLRPDLLEQILKVLSQFFVWSEDTEITMECNPKTVDREKLADFHSLGINRLSLGVQSFQDKFLKTLGRIHSGDDAKRVLAAARSAGFDNINLDLIFGQPGQSFDDWKKDVDQALYFETQHLSCYGLTIEPGTAFSRHYPNAVIASSEGASQSPSVPERLPSENTVIHQFQWTRERLDQAGLSAYEISNFARPGFECRHNINYWNQGDYLGLGVSAASYFHCRGVIHRAPTHGIRRTNQRNLKGYLDNWDVFEEDIIDTSTAQAEFMMLGLRQSRGVSEQRFLECFGMSLEDVYGQKLQALVSEGLIAHCRGAIHRAQNAGVMNDAPTYRLTKSGLLLADEVIMSFL